MDLWYNQDTLLYVACHGLSQKGFIMNTVNLFGGALLEASAGGTVGDTISGVIYQKGAFSCLYDGQFDKPVSSSAYSAARDALNGMDPSGGAIYYFNPATATNKWIWSRPAITTIGNHIFCE